MPKVCCGRLIVTWVFVYSWSLKRNKLKDAYIRLVVTRGPGDLGLDPRKCVEGGSTFIITDKIALYPKKFYDKGLKIITAKTKRNLPHALNPKIKSLNYLVCYFWLFTVSPNLFCEDTMNFTPFPCIIPQPPFVRQSLPTKQHILYQYFIKTSTPNLSLRSNFTEYPLHQALFVRYNAPPFFRGRDLIPP